MIGHRFFLRDLLLSNKPFALAVAVCTMVAAAANSICAKPAPEKRSFRSLLQPTFTTCGQTSVAMVTGVDVDTVVKVVGTDRGTTPAQLVHAIRQLKPKSSPRVVWLNGRDPGTNSVVELFDRSAGKFHWTVYHDGTYYDPIFGRLSGYPDWVQKQVAIVTE
jgi:hypothetical protein